MAKNTRGTHSELVHCDNCGEDYSATYKRCPFCGARPDRTGYTQVTGRFDLTGRTSADGRRTARPQEDTDRTSSRSRVRPQEEDDYVFDGGDVFDDEEDDDYYVGRRGGKRLADGGFDISPTTIAGIVFSVVIIIAAILVVALVIVPMVQSGRTPTASNSPNPSLTGGPNNSSQITGSPSPSVPVSPTGGLDDPDGTTTPTTSPDPSVSPSVPVSTPPVTSGGFTLLNYRNKPVEDFTISDRYPDPVQLKASGASGAVTWTSSNNNVATVSSSGVVTAVSKGNATITATDSTGQSRTCRVIVSITGGAAQPSPSASSDPQPSASTAPSGSLALNKTDITINDRWPDPVTLKPSGASGAVSWSSSKPEVATVDANGKVTRVGKGTATITATDEGGNKATCIVRCS